VRKKGKKEGKGREIFSKFATPGEIPSLQPVPKNLCFIHKKLQLLSLDPLSGLCPWTPLGDFRFPDPLISRLP